MARGRYVPWPAAVAVAVLALATGPGVASAHEVAGSRFDAPLPLWLLLAGAGATVALTALWLAVTERSVRTADDRSPSGPSPLLTVDSRVNRGLQVVAGAAFFAGFVVTLVVGFTGRQVAAENFATVFAWPVWFRGLALVAVVVGSVWPALSPWRHLYRGLCRLEGRQLAVVGSYPSLLGHWPALVGFLALVGVVENLTVVPRSPALTAGLVAGYALVMLLGAVAFGPAWFDHADPLGVFYRLFGRVAGIRLSRTDAGDLAVRVRPPWRNCRRPVAGLALVAFVVAAVYTVSFDGFTDTRLYQTVLFGTRDALGLGRPTSILLYLVGLAGFVGAFLATGLLCDAFGATGSERTAVAADGGSRVDWRGAARQFAPTVLPIAAAYEVAHNYPYVLRNTARLLGIAAEPLGVAVGAVEPLGWLSLPLFWGSQAVLIVVGHVVAVVAAHRVASDRYPSLSAVRRGHLPLVVLMIGYTVLSLWIVSRPVVAG
ncbi:hypothetical protein [Halorientalis marina]|uniref:hypothetical protein n=1 Tax=Halorientalis marina TaxID=2931976 RepID=UPI001FF2AA0B|nr:hypothetical protein [Halorientalis marina]